MKNKYRMNDQEIAELMQESVLYDSQCMDIMSGTMSDSAEMRYCGILSETEKRRARQARELRNREYGVDSELPIEW